MELHSGPACEQSSPLLFKGAGAVQKSSGLVCICGRAGASESEFWWTEDWVMGSTCALVFSSDEIMGSQFVCAVTEGVELVCVCLSALDLCLIFACLTDIPKANFSVFESTSCAVFTGGLVAQCASCSASVYP